MIYQVIVQISFAETLNWYTVEKVARFFATLVRVQRALLLLNFRGFFPSPYTRRYTMYIYENKIFRAVQTRLTLQKIYRVLMEINNRRSSRRARLIR